MLSSDAAPNLANNRAKRQNGIHELQRSAQPGSFVDRVQRLINFRQLVRFPRAHASRVLAPAAQNPAAFLRVGRRGSYLGCSIASPIAATRGRKRKARVDPAI